MRLRRRRPSARAPAWRQDRDRTRGGACIPPLCCTHPSPDGACAKSTLVSRQGECRMNYSTDFASVRGSVSPEEWKARCDLAACYRLMDAYGMTDLIYNPVSYTHLRAHET